MESASQGRAQVQYFGGKEGLGKCGDVSQEMCEPEKCGMER